MSRQQKRNRSHKSTIPALVLAGIVASGVMMTCGGGSSGNWNISCAGMAKTDKNASAMPTSAD